MIPEGRVTLLSGHYGSGKTNIAVNLATELRKRYEKVTVADLDIVNPYFRTLDSREDFEHAGIRLIVSAYANTNLDAPALPQEIYTIVDDLDARVVVDVGGDDRGALALGRISGRLLQEADYRMLLVVNFYRPLTRTPEDVLQVKREIEAAAGLPFTGLVNNSNLGAETEPETVLRTVPLMEETSKIIGLPIVMTTVEESLYDALNGKIPDLFPLRLQKRPVE